MRPETFTQTLTEGEQGWFWAKLEKKTNQELNQHSHFCRFICHYSKSNQGYCGVLKKCKIHRNRLVPEITVFKLAINSVLQKETPATLPDVTASKQQWSLMVFSCNDQVKEPDCCSKLITYWLRKATEVCLRGEEEGRVQLCPGRASKSLECSSKWLHWGC